MQQLAALDNMFLRMESKRVPAHVSSLIFLEPTTSGKEWGISDVRKMLESRIHLVPPLRRRLAYVPGNLDHPYWIEDPDFDLDYHLRHRALPRPGNRKQLEDLICQIFMRTLDRTRPLWEIYLIEGLEKGQMALFTKMHHACIDGVSGQEIMSTLLDLTPKVRKVPPPERAWKPEQVPAPLDLLTRAAKNYISMPRRLLDILPQTMTSIKNLSMMALSKETRGKLPDSIFDAPRSLFNQRASTHRRFAFESVPLSEIKALKDVYQCSLNDMVMALCAGALRQFCLDNDALPKAALVAMIPISVQQESTKGQLGNHVSGMLCSLATHVEDPIERLKLIVDSSTRGKIGHKMIGATAMMDWSQFAGPALLGLANSLIFRLGVTGSTRPTFNVAISNVPGVRVPLYWAGARVLSNYPMSLTTDNMGINITLVSYQDNLDFGVTVDQSIVSDPWVIVKHLKATMAEYKRLAQPKNRKAKTVPAGSGV